MNGVSLFYLFLKLLTILWIKRVSSHHPFLCVKIILGEAGWELYHSIYFSVSGLKLGDIFTPDCGPSFSGQMLIVIPFVIPFISSVRTGMLSLAFWSFLPPTLQHSRLFPVCIWSSQAYQGHELFFNFSFRSAFTSFVCLSFSFTSEIIKGTGKGSAWSLRLGTEVAHKAV